MNRKGHNVYSEIDCWIPELKIGFEYQVSNKNTTQHSNKKKKTTNHKHTKKK